MKTKIIFLFFALIAATSNAQNIFVPGADGSYDFTGNTTIVLKTDSAFITYKDSFGLRTNDTMRITFSQRDAVDTLTEYLTYKQYYKGFEVENALFNAHAKSGVIKSMQGKIIPGLNIDVANPISEGSALTAALNFIGASEYAWQNEEYEIALIVATNNADTTYYPRGTLLIGRVNPDAGAVAEGYAFVWRFDILATDPYQSYQIYVGMNKSITVGCWTPFTPAPDINNYDIQSALSDDFTAGSSGPGGLNSNKWGFDYNCNAEDYHQPANLSFVPVPDGTGTANVLRITTKAELPPITPCPTCSCYNHTNVPYGYSSAKFNSNEMFLYGYFDFRCKFPSQSRFVSQDYWFWGEWHTGNGYPSIEHYSELDVIEHMNWSPWDPSIPFDPTMARKRYPINFHDGLYGTGSANPACNNSSGGEHCYTNNFDYNTCLELYQQFHTFGMAWTPSAVTFYMDGHALPDIPNAHNGYANIHRVIQMFRECQNVPPCPAANTESVSKIKAMYAIIGQTVRDRLTNPPIPGPGNELKFDIDYFHYYKRKPDIISAGCANPNSTLAFTASMFGGANTSDTYAWTAFPAAACSIASPSSAATNITFNSGYNSVDITVVATETGPGYINNSGNPYTYGTARVSRRTKTIYLSPTPAPALSLVQIGNTCAKQAMVVEQPGAEEYYFSFNGGPWVLGTRHLPGLYANNYFNTVFWTHGQYTQQHVPFAVQVKSRNCAGDSPVNSVTFSSWTIPIGCFRIDNSFKNDISQFQLYPNPAGNELTVKYSINKDRQVLFEIATITGSVVEHYELKEQSNQLRINTEKWHGGIYLCRLLQDNGENQIQKLVIIK